ncbi:MAG: UDP-N-acetylmuramoyl-tripeptide--D-alanyl-D-alanine ligase [bacterium]
MKKIQQFGFEEIASWCDAQHRGDATIQGVSTDTRSIVAGDLFVALKGPNFDGHDYLEAAKSAGAAAVLVSREVDVDLPVLRVDDTLLGLQAIARRLFLEIQATGVQSIALTGSNGKTTTKEMVAALLEASGRVVHATPGNLNNHIGVPLTICAAPDDTEVLVLEMGCNKFGDISELVSIAACDVRVITSIGHAHIENLGDLDGVRRVKSEIFERADAQTVAVVPFDERERLGLRGFPGTVFTAGFAQGADLVVRAQPLNDGQSVTLRSDDDTEQIELPLPGPHNAQNFALAWLAVSKGAKLDLVPHSVQARLQRFALPGGRLKRISSGPWEIVDDAYNANPTSARASFEAFLELPGPRPRIAVLGEMLELGDKSEQLHRDLARSVASRGGVEYLAFVGKHAKAMEEGALEVGAEAHVFATTDLEEAGTFVRDAGPGFVFLKASRGAKLERIIDRILPATSTE